MNSQGLGATAGRLLAARLGAVTITCGVVVAISPAWPWFRGISAGGSWSGFGLHADRARLGVEGNGFVMGFAVGDWYHSIFGPLVPLLVGAALCILGLVFVLRRSGRTVTRGSPWIAATALWSLGAAGVTGGSDVQPVGAVGGSGVRVWAIASAIAAAAGAIGVMAGGVGAAGGPAAGVSGSRRCVEWVGVPAILLGGVCGTLLQAAEERQPFAAGPVFLAASLTVALLSAGTVAALVSLSAPRRPMPVTVVNTGALVIGALQFLLWTHVAVA